MDVTLLELTSEEWKFPSAELLAESDGAGHESDDAQDGENEDAADEDGDISSGDGDDSHDESEDEITPNTHASQVRPPIPTAAANDRLLAILRDAGAWRDIFPGGARSLQVILRLQPLPC